MKHQQITQDNKAYMVKKYCDHVLSNMDDYEIYSELKEYFFREKIAYPLITLTQEIERYCPQILEDNMVENVFGKDHEYTTNNDN